MQSPSSSSTVKDNNEVVKQLFVRFLNRPGKPDEVTAAAEMFDQLEQENAKLLADLDAYEKELGPKLAQKELDRQNRIAGLQTELEAYREIAKLRGPRAEKERQDRIAKAQAAIAENDKKLMEKLPKFEANQKKKTRWYPLEALEMGATYRAKFARQADGSIFVDGDKAQGAYRVVAPLPLDKVTGIRLDALADDRLPNKGPGRSADGNFVVTEFAAHLLPAPGPMKLVRSWDFSGTDDGWQNEEGAKSVADSGMRHLFGTGKPAGIKTTLKEPAGAYLLDVVTGIRSGVTFTVQWTTAAAPKFEDARTSRRSLPAGTGGSTATPIAIFADAELTGVRIFVDDDQAVLPIDAIRLFSADSAGAAAVKLKKSKATFSQAGYASPDRDRWQHDRASRQRLGHRPANRPRPIGRLRVGEAARRREGPPDRVDDLPKPRRRSALARQVPHLGHRAARRSISACPPMLPQSSPKRKTNEPTPIARSCSACFARKTRLSRNCKPT